MGLFTFCLGGGAFLVIGACEFLFPFCAYLNTAASPPPTITTSLPPPNAKKRRHPMISSFSLLLIALTSFFFIIDSILSSIDASQHNDRVGFVLQFQASATASLFLVYSVVAFLMDHTHLLLLPPSILNLLALFAFGEEFLMFYLQRKDPSGLENRYFDLLLVPISVCFVSTLLDMGRPKSFFPSMARGVGLILQGTWFVQMGFSFYTNLMARGCSLHEKSRGNYTIKCKGHPEYHRGNAIATLQFNCHLASLVTLIVAVYTIFSQGYRPAADYQKYRLLSEELRQLDNQSQFTLNSFDDEEDLASEGNTTDQKPTLSPSSINGFGAH